MGNDTSLQHHSWRSMSMLPGHVIQSRCNITISAWFQRSIYLTCIFPNQQNNGHFKYIFIRFLYLPSVAGIHLFCYRTWHQRHHLCYRKCDYDHCRSHYFQWVSTDLFTVVASVLTFEIWTVIATIFNCLTCGLCAGGTGSRTRGRRRGFGRSAGMTGATY